MKQFAQVGVALTKEMMGLICDGSGYVHDESNVQVQKSNLIQENKK